MRTLIRSAVALSLAVLGAAASAAPVISYPDFSNPAGLTINGNASVVGNALRVTPATFNQAGSAFSTSTVSLASNASFSTYFQFRFTGAGVSDGQGFGADGLTFVVQTVSNNVGTGGGGIGYQGIANSIGIEFDTWNNGGIDGNSSNHIGINANGDVNSLVRAQVAEADMNNGGVWNAWIDYDGTSNLLEVRLTQSALRPASALLSLTRNIVLDLGSTNAFVGFTSGTGAAYANHDVLSWTLEDDFRPIGTVPEPGSLALVGLALVAGGVLRRRA